MTIAEELAALHKEMPTGASQIAATLTLAAANLRPQMQTAAQAIAQTTADYRHFLRLLLNKEAEEAAQAEKEAAAQAKADEAQAVADAKAAAAEAKPTRAKK